MKTSSKALKWIGEKLYWRKEFLIEIISDVNHVNMFRLKWADGVISDTFYNHPWARENAIKEGLKIMAAR